MISRQIASAGRVLGCRAAGKPPQIVRVALPSASSPPPTSGELILRTHIVSAKSSVSRPAGVIPAVFSARFKTGPAASPTIISDELLGKLGKLSTQALIDGLWVMGWPTSFIEGARPLAKGMKCVGRAVTMR